MHILIYGKATARGRPSLLQVSLFQWPLLRVFRGRVHPPENVVHGSRSAIGLSRACQGVVEGLSRAMSRACQGLVKGLSRALSRERTRWHGLALASLCMRRPCFSAGPVVWQKRSCSFGGVWRFPGSRDTLGWHR